MPSKIQVDQIAGATGSTVTLPSGQTLDLSSGTVTLPSTALSALNATNLTSGTVPSARLSLISSDLPTVPTTKGGTGLTTIGTASQVLRVNSGATGLEFGTISAGKLLQIQTAVATSSVTGSATLSTYHGGTLPSNFGTSFITISFTPTSASSKLVVMANAPMGIDGNALGMCNVTHNNDTIGAFMGNGYAADGCGATITAFVASGSTSARNISFRVVGGWSGEAVRLGGMRSTTLSTAMTSSVFGTLTVLEIEP